MGDLKMITRHFRIWCPGWMVKSCNLVGTKPTCICHQSAKKEVCFKSMSAKQKLIGYTCGLCILIPCVINNVRHVQSEYLTMGSLFDPCQITSIYDHAYTRIYELQETSSHYWSLESLNCAWRLPSANFVQLQIRSAGLVTPKFKKPKAAWVIYSSNIILAKVGCLFSTYSYPNR